MTEQEDYNECNIRDNAPPTTQFYNDEFEENGDVIYLRRHQGVLQYFSYRNTWDDLLFNMPYKPLP